MRHIPEERSIYRRWGYDPYDDTVYINDRKDLDQSGYAYRIDGGWRLTDEEHDAVNDPYIIKKVMEALRGGADAPEPADYHFGKLHYGQPFKKGI